MHSTLSVMFASLDKGNPVERNNPFKSSFFFLPLKYNILNEIS